MTLRIGELPDRRGTGSFKWDLAGPDEIPLWVADMDFPVEPRIVDAMRRRLEHPVFGYSSVPAAYPEAFRRWQKERNRWEIDPDHLLVIPSVMQGLAVAIEAFTTVGDRIGVLSPVYFPFYDAVEELGRRIVRLPLMIEENDRGRRYRIDHQLIREQAPTLSMILLCSPHNPGGRVWSAEELMDLTKIAADAGVPVISDEIHSDLVFPGERFTPWLTVSEGSGDVALLAPSKTFNIPGLPTAWAVVPDPETRKTLAAALHARMHKLSNLLTMEAALAAYRAGGPWLEETRATLSRHFRFVTETLAKETGVTVFMMEGTFIAWIDLRERWGLPVTDRFPAAEGRQGPDHSLSRRFGTFARKHGVWLSDGSQFGPEGDGFMRLNFATSGQRLTTGIERLETAIAEFDPR
ncbi:MAG: MalY/PatB family protein [Alkalispirochaeta sp.]